MKSIFRRSLLIGFGISLLLLIIGLMAAYGSIQDFSSYTPLLVIIVAGISCIVSLISYIRINKDINHRAALQNELEKKEEAIKKRIDIIQDIANKISEGNYSIRIDDSIKDQLGGLAVSLNKMASSLEYSFNLLSDKEWLQAGIAGLHEKMLGEYDLGTLISRILDYITGYTRSQVAAYYRIEGSTLQLAGGYALLFHDSRNTFQVGEGLTGQCAASGKMMVVEDIPSSHIIISFAAGGVKPLSIVAIPVLHESTVTGVIELASIKKYSSREKSFLEAVSHNAGIAINGVRNRKKMQTLLEETQSQAKELQGKQHELELINAELETQTQKLQASEEELRVQQEELLEANQELEERSRMLEERNQVIHEGNLAIRQKAEELAVSTRYKSEFLANMSHELRTPLNSILLLSRLMKENKDGNLLQEQVQNAGVILSSGEALLSLIDEILDLSRIEAGKMVLQYESVSIQGIIQDIRSLFVPVAAEKGLAFDVHLQENIPAAIETDKMRLLQVVRNLLSNAFKFTAKGTVSLDIWRAPVNDLIAITVKDTGIGIPKDKHHLIFEAFQQADGSTHRKYGGTGLGLSISRELARLLGGSIELESEPGKGSAFTVYVPLSKVTTRLQEVSLSNGVPEPAPVEEKIEKTVPARFTTDVIPKDVPDDRKAVKENDKVILIVEDDTAFARSLLDFTHSKGYRGIVTVRGDEAVELARKYKPVGILLDIQLPVKDGWEVMDELKSDPQTKHIPVHVMSSYEVRSRSISKGAIDFVNKPVTLDQMQNVFQKIEYVLNNNPRKVLIVEENSRHAKALSYFLASSEVNAEIRNSVTGSIDALRSNAVNCVILDMGIPGARSYDTLEEVKKTPGLENIPIIIFTGQNLSRTEEMRIKQYADSIVIKTAHSYQRILDEVSLFLHLVGEQQDAQGGGRYYKTVGALQEVLKGKTVLVADDDVRNIYSLTRSLENAGMQVVSATDGREALKQLEQHPGVDIILMDMMMPEMDGYESTRQIRAGNAHRNIPVIAVTAKAMTGDREKCISAGASDYITKPVDVDQLLSLLRVWLYDTNR